MGTRLVAVHHIHTEPAVRRRVVVEAVRHIRRAGEVVRRSLVAEDAKGHRNRVEVEGERHGPGEDMDCAGELVCHRALVVEEVRHNLEGDRGCVREMVRRSLVEEQERHNPGEDMGCEKEVELLHMGPAVAGNREAAEAGHIGRWEGLL